jgi:hypothetical protein
MLSLVSEAYAPYVETFYSATVEGTPALREHCYRNVACRLINYEAVLQEMAAVRWDRRDIASEACCTVGSEGGVPCGQHSAACVHVYCFVPKSRLTCLQSAHVLFVHIFLRVVPWLTPRPNPGFVPAHHTGSEQHSKYVDHLVREFVAFSTRLNALPEYVRPDIKASAFPCTCAGSESLSCPCAVASLQGERPRACQDASVDIRHPQRHVPHRRRPVAGQARMSHNAALLPEAAICHGLALTLTPCCSARRRAGRR